MTNEKISVFDEAPRLVATLEHRLIGEDPPASPVGGSAMRVFWMPWKFLSAGYRVRKINSFQWAFITLLFINLPLLFLAVYQMRHLEHNVMPWSMWVLAGVLVLEKFLQTFQLPSVYGNPNVSKEHVDFVVKYLTNRNFSSGKQIDLLMKSIVPVREASRARN